MIRIPQITIPRQPRTGLDVLAWAKDVNYAIKQLASIKEDFFGGGGGGGKGAGNTIQRNANTHPWKCVANGTDSIYVGEGRIHSYLDGATTLASNSMAGFGDWEGGSVTVTAATGVIYGEIPAALSLYPIVDFYVSSAGESDDVQITLMRTMPDTGTAIAVYFAETMPIATAGETFYWEIAQVALTDDVATITKQVLRHDPMLWSFAEPP